MLKSCGKGVSHISVMFGSEVMSIIHFHEKSKMAAYEPDGTYFHLGNIKIQKLGMFRISKIEVREIHHLGAWEPPIPTRLYSYPVSCDNK